MQVATWNVNSIKVRLQHVLDWLSTSQCDVLCLQELKMVTEKFPEHVFTELGYHARWIGQKTYNGVAIISRYPLSDIVLNNPHFEDEEKRLITATVHSPIGDIRVVCAYCPNGRALDHEKYPYKLAWYKALRQWVEEQLQHYPQVIVTGDFNVAPADADIYTDYSGDILISPPEREAFQSLLELGLSDSFRLFPQAENSFSWWDYRAMNFVRNNGGRIDHILISAKLTEKCQSCHIDKAPRKLDKPSDHTPVVATFKE